jgi:CubicO group peptidase (beta-lactamase class C family)
VSQVDTAGIEEAERLFTEWFATARAPGLAWGVVADGELVHAAGLGELHVGAGDQPTADSSFRIASMTKSFVAAMILLLRDEGRLRLDDPVAQHVPELQGLPLPTADSPAPTLRDLLSMRSGYPEDDPWADRLEAMATTDYLALIARPATHARVPGVAFDYSNYGFTLLGQVISNVCADAYQDAIRERLLEPLGLANTTWSGSTVEPSRLAAGYHLIDGIWVEQPVQEPGAFSALGGLHSTVADLAVWVQGFVDAFPPRDAPDGHPLSRASRREMQQIITAIPLQLEAGQQGALSVRSDGYCLGLLSMEDLRSGRTVGHSGGYPGFGSHMRWHPATGIGLIALANGRYARPSAALLPALEALVRRAPQRTRVQPLPDVLELKPTIDAALAAGDLSPLLPHLADNVALDEALDRRAAAISELPTHHGSLTPGDVTALTPTQATWWLDGERGRVGVEVMLTPEQPPRLQKLAIESVHPATDELEGAVAGALEAIRRGTDLTPLLLPIRSASWVACDGERTAAVLLEGALVDVRLLIDLDADPVATFEPEERFPSPW